MPAEPLHSRRAPLRRSRLSAAGIAVALGVVLLAGAPAARAQDPHAVRGMDHSRTLGELTPQQRAAAIDAFDHVVCACPKENWSRTLGNCPDACADKQKQEVLARIVEGVALPAIVAEQVRNYGPKAASDPGTARSGALWVVVAMGLGAIATIVVFARWSARARRTARAPSVAGQDASAVERELRELDG